MTAKPAALVIAPPTPCTSRAAISQPAPGASAHNAEPMAKTATPGRKTFFRPMLSASRPETINRAPTTML